MEHPFAASHFKIRDRQQIQTIRSLGLTRVRWSPQLSDLKTVEAARETETNRGPAADLAPPAAASAADEDATFATDVDEAVRLKQEQAQQMAQHRAALKESQRQLTEAARTFRNLSQQLYARPTETRDMARDLIGSLAANVLGDSDVAIHLVSDKVGNENLYHHSLNVSLLTMLLARELKLPETAVAGAGLGALLHDAGLADVPERIWRKPPPHTQAERALVESHVIKGLEVGKRMDLPPEALLILAQHHEHSDGTGYPRKLSGAQITLPARLVAVVDTYDTLCNPWDRSAGMTPHEALAHMYRHRRNHFDEKVLSTFIRVMGIYPPGTLVELSDQQVGMVVAVNNAHPLKPTVLLYRSDVPKDAALLADLSTEPELTVARTLRPSELPQSALDYLAPNQRLTYFLQRSIQNG